MTNIKEYAMPHDRSVVFVLGTMLALAVPVQATAATAEKNDTKQPAITSNADAWQFEITPYLLAAGLNGQVVSTA